MVRIKPRQRAAQFREKLFQFGQRKPAQNIAYFCMEYGLRPDLPIYSGGLGLLAGDTVKSAADLGVPMVAVGILYRDGYFRQIIEDGRQRAEAQSWNPGRYPGLIDLKDAVSIPIGGETVNFRLWGHEVQGEGGEFVPLLLLDSRGASNPPGYGEITSQLYVAGSWERLTQEMALGIGGVRALEWAGIPIAFYHLNEGHAAFATVEVLNRLGKAFENLTPEDFKRIRELFSFTTHTPVPAGFDRFPIDLVSHAFSDAFLRTAVLTLGKDPYNQSFINMALLAMRLSGIRNGVSVLHAQVSEEMFPDFRPIIPITNGVHHLTWIAEATGWLLDEYCPEWRKDPSKLSGLFALKGDSTFRGKLWQVHQENKRRLLQLTRDTTGVEMSEDVFTLCSARRFAGYKRGDLIFTHEDELLKIVDELGGLQLIVAGKAHPADGVAKNIIAHVIEAGNRLMERSGGKFKFAFVPNYNLQIGAAMTAGADAWLNNPLRPYEASGTSGMKASLNGVPNLSVADGWWEENRGGGWTVGDKNSKPHEGDPMLYQADAASLYGGIFAAGKFYHNRAEDPTYGDKMVEALAGNGSHFNTHRMVNDYAEMVWRSRVAQPLEMTPRIEAPSATLGEIFNEIAKISFAIAGAKRDHEIEEIAAEGVIRTLKEDLKISRYEMHHGSVRIERRWVGKRLGDVIYEEPRSEMGDSVFYQWRDLEEFSQEVMGDVLRDQKIQVVPEPEKDERCMREGRLVSRKPFILIPEIVNGEIRGAYKVDFLTGELKGVAVDFLGSLMEVIGKAKAKLLSKQLIRDMQGLKTEEEVINWSLVLMTAGGFVDMPRYAVETNRAALFLADEGGELTGRQAIGDISEAEHQRKLASIHEDMFREGVQADLRSYDQNRASLNLHIQGKTIGPNVIYAPIRVENGIPLFDHREFNGEFDTRKLAQMKRNVEELFAVNGRTVEDYLLFPVRGLDRKLYGMVYVDNAFSGKPLSPEKYLAIIQAAIRRIAELRSSS